MNIRIQLETCCGCKRELTPNVYWDTLPDYVQINLFTGTLNSGRVHKNLKRFRTFHLVETKQEVKTVYFNSTPETIRIHCGHYLEVQE